MPDTDKETRYYGKNNILEQRCRYCPQTYELNGGTYIITQYLTTGTLNKGGHRLKPLSTRIKRAKNS